MTTMRTAGKRGRLPAKPEGERFAIRFVHEYAATPLPAAAYPVDVTGGITDWRMLGNGPDPSVPEHPDGIGDCTFAAREHVRYAKAAAGHETETFETAADLVAEYLAYDHGQDLGAQLADVLLTWYHQGKILAFAPVDHTDPAAVDAAMQAFHGAYCGVSLTDDASQLFQAGHAWTVDGGQEPDPAEGHCIVKVIADGHGGDGWVTWGGLQGATAAWTAACLDEAWVIITQEDADAASLDIAALRADIAALHGTGGDSAPPAPAAAASHESLLAEFATLVRTIAASADRDVAEAVAWLHSHGI